ncbi:hypothetical protein AB4851_12880 [Burkholderia sp. 22PA0099]|uniref:hypothetical protein n=1 Tax=Burkholderia sp. 22PA0099 TaxID=3237372 RepID=UPI0039C34EA4
MPMFIACAYPDTSMQRAGVCHICHSIRAIPRPTATAPTQAVLVSPIASRLVPPSSEPGAMPRLKPAMFNPVATAGANRSEVGASFRKHRHRPNLPQS